MHLKLFLAILDHVFLTSGGVIFLSIFPSPKFLFHTLGEGASKSGDILTLFV